MVLVNINQHHPLKHNYLTEIKDNNHAFLDKKKYSVLYYTIPTYLPKYLKK